MWTDCTAHIFSSSKITISYLCVIRYIVFLPLQKYSVLFWPIIQDLSVYIILCNKLGGKVLSGIYMMVFYFVISSVI